jgi:hypothetical protein
MTQVTNLVGRDIVNLSIATSYTLSGRLDGSRVEPGPSRSTTGIPRKWAIPAGRQTDQFAVIDPIR